MDPHEADRVRAESLERWERAAPAWGRNAERIREWGMALSTWMIDALELQPGQRVLELAAGPGDTGFMAAELVAPGGTLICSDGAEAMLEVARRRAGELGISGVEFKALQLEWIDLPAAGVDAVLCRWGLTLALDPEAAAQEMRRVLRPGGRIAVAVWDLPEHNPWATIAQRALTDLGLMAAPDPAAPGMFALSGPGRLEELLQDAGFGDVVVGSVEVPRHYPDLESYVYETSQLSGVFRDHWAELDEERRAQVRDRMAVLAAPFAQGPSGALELPGRSLAAVAEA